MKSDFMDRAAKIMAEIRTISFTDKFDTKFIEDILKEELEEYYAKLEEYYAKLHGYYDAAYDKGHSDGYALAYEDGRSAGYSEGYSEGHSEVKTLLRMR